MTSPTPDPSEAVSRAEKMKKKPPSWRVILKGKISQEELQRLYHQEQLSPEKIAQKFGVMSHGVLYLLKEYGIPKRSESPKPAEDQLSMDWDAPPVDRPTPEGNALRKRVALRDQVTKADLERLYHKEGLSQNDIAQEYGFTRQAIYDLLKEHGIAARGRSKARILALTRGKFEGKSTASLRESLFSKWSQPMAYLLGYIFTDGSLAKAGPGCHRVAISSTDREHLEKLAAILGKSISIRTHKQSKKGFSGTEDRYIHSIEFTRPEMIEDLRKLGLTERKSLTMQFPDVPEEFLRDFIRGCWDGDGSLSVSVGELRASYVTGSQQFIHAMRERLDNRGFGRMTIQTRQPDGITTRNLSYSIVISSAAAVRFCEFLYKDVPDTLLLSRKHLIYKNFPPYPTRVGSFNVSPFGPIQAEPTRPDAQPHLLEAEATTLNGAGEHRGRCAAFRNDGSPCTFHPLPESQYCGHHQTHGVIKTPGV